MSISRWYVLARFWLQGVQELVEFLDGKVQDRLVLENFFGLSFLDCEVLACLATTGVLVRGFVGNRFAWGEIKHGFCDSVIRWVVLTFLCYQCNESRILSVRKDQRSSSVIRIMYLRQFTYVYIVNYKVKYRKLRIELIMSQGLCHWLCCNLMLACAVPCRLCCDQM